uniref:Protein DEK n=1 Tax=Timema monikensis TaxID=170555 RepID=A0A7R9EIQ5_9NEOP|nr:unnamed protein product [Timema monikensis]
MLQEPKSKKKVKSTPNSKKFPAKKNTPAKKGGGNKKAEKKSSVKKRKSDDKSGEQSSSEDEPLSKKSKMPPTDEEIKSYVKEILEGANLEEITMKTVCKQVYSNYPDFDLAHKKDFIKTTVKSHPGEMDLTLLVKVKLFYEISLRGATPGQLSGGDEMSVVKLSREEGVNYESTHSRQSRAYPSLEEKRKKLLEESSQLHTRLLSLIKDPKEKAKKSDIKEFDGQETLGRTDTTRKGEAVTNNQGTSSLTEGASLNVTRSEAELDQTHWDEPVLELNTQYTH